MGDNIHCDSRRVGDAFERNEMELRNVRRKGPKKGLDEGLQNVLADPSIVDNLVSRSCSSISCRRAIDIVSLIEFGEAGSKARQVPAVAKANLWPRGSPLPNFHENVESGLARTRIRSGRFNLHSGSPSRVRLAGRGDFHVTYILRTAIGASSPGDMRTGNYSLL